MPLGFPRRILFVGYGSVAQALTPLLFRHFPLEPGSVCAIAADDLGRAVAAEFGVQYENLPLTAENYAAVLGARLSAGDLLINVSVEVSSFALVQWARDHGVLYLDTCVEPWVGGYESLGQEATNYALRRDILTLASPGSPTAVIAHGANPGLVSHFVKEGLLELASLRGLSVGSEGWAQIAQALDVQVIQIAELDTQSVREQPVPSGGFFNTWSTDGFLAEAWQYAELGWGSHERTLPPRSRRHDAGDQSGIYLLEHSADVIVKSWAPAVGAQRAYLITHHEALSLASMLTIHGDTPAQPVYRPTVYYAYHPCPAACHSLEAWRLSNYRAPTVKQVLRDELVDGFDQLGVLFMFPGGAYWYGSTLSLEEARRLAPFNSATSLQVAAGILGALTWMFENPNEGVVEAEALDHDTVMAVASPYLGQLHSRLTDWQPGPDLQFGSFRVADNEVHL